MAELGKSKRVLFPKGRQRRFIEKAQQLLGAPNRELARMLGICVRSLTDWKREKLTMSLGAVRFLLKKTGDDFPKNAIIKEPFWYVHKGARSGGLARWKKYGNIGDPEKRKKKWLEWWEREGKKKGLFIAKSIQIPRKDVELAEFVGIMMGDGGISRYQVVITLNRKTDAGYILFVNRLIQKLFGVVAQMYPDKHSAAVDIVVSRKELVKYCQKLGLSIGNKLKQGLDVPAWIKKDKGSMRACMRGLVDTDGCVFSHSYRSKGKKYQYAKMSFSSRSPLLINTVYKFFKKEGFSPRIVRSGSEVRIESVQGLISYFRTIGTSNPKHLKRYQIAVRV